MRRPPGQCVKPPSASCLKASVCGLVSLLLSQRTCRGGQTAGRLLVGPVGRETPKHHFPGATSGKWLQPHYPWFMSVDRSPFLPHPTGCSWQVLPLPGPQFPHVENDSWETPHKPRPAPAFSDSKTCVNGGGSLFGF